MNDHMMDAHRLLRSQPLRPFLIIHEHRFGDSRYMMWGEQAPSEEEVLKHYPNLEFEPEIGEFLTIHEVTLDELFGVQQT